jgi:hypothetical protein
MLVHEVILEAGATIAWKHKPGTTSDVRKYRCTSGIRKGQMRSSPAACNAPYQAHKAITLKANKAKTGSHAKFKARYTKAHNPGSRRLKVLNKPKATPRRRKIR